ncbi:hypothetical protein CRG98_024141 [Punica granatum]|uniref:Uncharacterized protein n=1 Tax=Punica granatum TaxID=22663 RepID=A0A2I0JH05_PUNGR|nr:hypothetical protein CRG98_024141 [Punica granatum]
MYHNKLFRNFVGSLDPTNFVGRGGGSSHDDLPQGKVTKGPWTGSRGGSSNGGSPPVTSALGEVDRWVHDPPATLSEGAPDQSSPMFFF